MSKTSEGVCRVCRLPRQKWSQAHSPMDIGNFSATALWWRLTHVLLLESFSLATCRPPGRVVCMATCWSSILAAVTSVHIFPELGQGAGQARPCSGCTLHVFNKNTVHCYVASLFRAPLRTFFERGKTINFAIPFFLAVCLGNLVLFSRARDNQAQRALEGTGTVQRQQPKHICLAANTRPLQGQDS